MDDDALANAAVGRGGIGVALGELMDDPMLASPRALFATDGWGGASGQGEQMVSVKGGGAGGAHTEKEE